MENPKKKSDGAQRLSVIGPTKRAFYFFATFPYLCLARLANELASKEEIESDGGRSAKHPFNCENKTDDYNNPFLQCGQNGCFSSSDFDLKISRLQY